MSLYDRFPPPTVNPLLTSRSRSTRPGTFNMDALATILALRNGGATRPGTPPFMQTVPQFADDSTDSAINGPTPVQGSMVQSAPVLPAGGTGAPGPVAVIPPPPNRADYLRNIPDYKDTPAFTPPERNTAGEARSNALGVGLTGLALLLAGRGNHIGQAQQAYLRGAQGTQDTNYQNRYRTSQTQFQNDVQRVNDANRRIGRQEERAGQQFTDDTRLYDRAQAQRNATARNAATVEAAKIKATQATQPKPDAITRERNGVFSTLEGLDDESQQHILSMLDSSGDAARLGIPTDKDANGKYTFRVHKQQPTRTSLDPVAKTRLDRLAHDKNQVEEDLRNPRLLDRDRPTLEARWKQLDKALGGPGMNPPRFDAFTPAEKEMMKRQTQRDAERRAREAKQDARQAATAAGKMDPATKLHRSDLVREASDLQELIKNPRISLAKRKQFAARLRVIRVNTGIGPKVPLNPEDVSDLTPGQVQSKNRFETNEYNRKSKNTKILSVEEDTEDGE